VADSLNLKISKILSRLADSKELIGSNPFKISAIRKASNTVANSNDSFHLIDDYQKIPGIGPSIAKKIAEIKLTGRLSELDELDEKIPAAFWELSKIRGLGLGSMKKLFKEKIFSYESLKENIFKNDLAFFSKSQNENIRRGIKLYASYKGKFLLSEGQDIFEAIQNKYHHIDFRETGGLRRCDEVLECVELIYICDPGFNIGNFASSLKGRVQGEQIEFSYNGRSIKVSISKKNEFGKRWLETTSTKKHLDSLKLYKVESEEEIYDLNGYSYIPPELRIWNPCEFKKNVPELLSIDDINLDMHMHTNWSDGFDSIDDMVSGSCAKGYSRIAITDHSKSASYAGGLKEESLFDQVSYIKNKNWDLEVLTGTECDILNDGSLDYDDSVLEKVDWVVASIHQNLNGDQTERILKALENPHINVLGHSTGRKLLTREGYDVDWPKVFSKLLERDIALEINGNPERLDVDASIAKNASKSGVKLSLNTDAHSIKQLDFMKMAVNQARRAGLDSSFVLNSDYQI
tara:strand:+ start:131 stop:1687 length:1557 start_codon:yes stop_codon:yes gene_type:complete